MPKTKTSTPDFGRVFDYFDTGASEYFRPLSGIEPTALVEKPYNYEVAKSPPDLKPVTKVEVKPELTVNPAITPAEQPIQYSWKDPRFREILLDRQLYNESRFRPEVMSGKTASSAGAIGVAQFMPGTWAEMIRKGYVPKDAKATDIPHAVKANYMYMQELYNMPTVQEAQDETERMRRTLAAYNSGPKNLSNRVARAKQLGVPWETLFKPETQKYIVDIPKDVQSYITKGNYKSTFDRSEYNK